MGSLLIKKTKYFHFKNFKKKDSSFFLIEKDYNKDLNQLKIGDETFLSSTFQMFLNYPNQLVN